VTLTRGPTIIAVVAAISLGINLFLAGEIVGRQFHHGPPPPPPPDFESHLGQLWHEMPEADRDIVRGIISRRRAELMEKWHDARAAGQAVIAALHANLYQAADLQSALGRWNQRTLDFRNNFQDMLVEIASQISPEGRLHLRFGPGADPHPPKMGGPPPNP
jgi:uncharacterized membrane protein